MGGGNKTGLLAHTERNENTQSEQFGTHRGAFAPTAGADAAGVSLCAAARYYLHFYHRRRALP